MEYLLTAFFYFRIYHSVGCSPKPSKYAFSAFGIIDLLATLPLYLAFLFPGARYPAYYTGIPPDTDIPHFQVIQFLDGRSNATDSTYETVARKIAVFFMFVVILVISIGTLMYMIEGGKPNTQFSNIPNSIYWACVSAYHGRLRRYNSCHRPGEILFGLCHADRLHYYCSTYRIVSVSLMKRHEKNVARECPNCHRRGHEESAQFCKYCGSSLDKAPKRIERLSY